MEKTKTPQIILFSENFERRLVDTGMLHLEASLAGFAERYERGKTSHTIHVWWARRPHSAMRALTFASLCKDTSKDALSLLNKLTISSVAPKRLITKARKHLLSQYKNPPRLLDMFGGGGTIAIEAWNLGADTYSIDSNQLSVFVQRCHLTYKQSINEKKKYQKS